MERDNHEPDLDIIELGSVSNETKGPGGFTGDSAGELSLTGLTDD